MTLSERLLVAVGSRRDRVCSIGSFARAEAKALEDVFKSVEVMEPNAAGIFPCCDHIGRPDVIFYHAPALHDRKRPWNALVSLMLLKRAFPKAKVVSIVHEFSEAPLHWKMRQVVLLRLSDGAIVNSQADFDGVRRWQTKVMRSRLGPTLFYSELFEQRADNESRLRALITKSRAEAAQSHGLPFDQKWLLHPGLLTPGKGVNFLGKLSPYIDRKTHLVVMGGIGPKDRDRAFAQKALNELKSSFKGSLTVIESPNDEIFRQMLVASDLVILPYDAGLSERRSSFLSAMSCGANVWTTTGTFTGALNIGNSGVHSVEATAWNANAPAVFESVTQVLGESFEQSLTRRMKNIEWAKGRSWDARARDVVKFISMLK